MNENDIARRMKQAREARKLSQRQLAAAAGVTSPMISMIEQGRTSPSVATLKKILGAMNMSLGAFFAEDEESTAKWHYAADEFLDINPANHRLSGRNLKAAISLRQVGSSGKSAIQMLHETYAPGADTGPEAYMHDAEEAGIVISGSIEITVDGDTRTLVAGDGYVFNSRLPHRFNNTGDVECIIVSACTPPTF